MSERLFSEAEWLTLDDEIQKRLRALSNQIRESAPVVEPHFGKTVTKLFPLFSYVTFKRSDDECIIVGVDIGLADGQWRIDADVSDEESGTVYFELPNTPFSASSFQELRDRLLRTTDQLIAGGKAVLLRLFGSPAAVPSGRAAALPDVARKG